jgi:hypothetical protein
MSTPAALFERQGDRLFPTWLARGPWNEGALHGGPTAALLARAIQRFDGGDGMFVSRITLELLRPVPFERLTVHAELLRPGRKVQLVGASLRTETKEVARATGLRLREKDVALPPDLPMEPVTVPLPEHGADATRLGEFLDGFHTHGVEHRFVRGQLSRPGPATDWIRLRVPVLEDEEPSSIERVCAAADFGNGASSILPAAYTYINPDLTIYLHRYPRGEWVCIDAVTRVESNGVGLAESRLLDREGTIGRALQSLIIDAR